MFAKNKIPLLSQINKSIIFFTIECNQIQSACYKNLVLQINPCKIHNGYFQHLPLKQMIRKETGDEMAKNR